MSVLFGPEFQALLAAAVRRVRSLRGRKDSELPSRRQIGAPRGAFAGHRRYSSGDDVRHVDWNAYARTGELFAKVFEEDERRALTLLLDCTPSMLASDRYDGARRMAALVGALALARLDGLRVVCGKDAVYTLNGAEGVGTLLKILDDVEPAVVDADDLARVPIDRGWLGSTCWISDFAEPDAHSMGLRMLRGAGRNCTGVLPAVPADRSPDVGGWIELRDPETGEIELVRVDTELRAAIESELELLERRQDALFAAVGYPLLRLPIPAAGDFRLTSWFPGRWISRI